MQIKQTMKTIDERAREYAKSQGGVGDITDPIYKAYMQGCADNFRALTEWHDPKEKPQEGAELLLKILMPVDEGDIRTYAVGDYIRNEFIMPNTYAGAKVLGWRKIHE